MFPPGYYDYVHILWVIQLPVCTMIGGAYTISLKNVNNISIKFLDSCFVCSPCSRIVLAANDDQRSKQFKENINMNKVTPHIHKKGLHLHWNHKPMRLMMFLSSCLSRKDEVKFMLSQANISRIDQLFKNHSYAWYLFVILYSYPSYESQMN